MHLFNKFYNDYSFKFVLGVMGNKYNMEIELVTSLK